MMQFGADVTLLDALDEGVVAVDAGSTIVFFNRAAERMFGYAASEVLGHPLDILLPSTARRMHHEHVETFRNSGEHSRMMSARSGVRGRRKDGSVFDAEASISRSTVGDSLVFIAIVRDVTARKAAESRLRASEQKHRAILATCTDAIVLANAETGIVVEVNERAGEMFGCPVDSLLGLHQSELHPTDDRERLRRTFREHVETGRIMVPDASIQRADGTVVPVEIAARPTAIDGTLTVVGFFRDITHRREHERELIEAREAAMAANRTKTTFLANISHELRTPLNAIIGLSEMIGNQYLGPVGHPKYLDYVHDIRDSGHHLLDLITDILDLSRVEMGKVTLHEETFDLGDLVDQCRRTVRQLVAESGLICGALVAPRARWLFADPRAVRQMLLNLLANAIKHTPRGGRIDIAADLDDGGSLSLTVTDTGVGIPPERLATVTTPFNSTNQKHVTDGSGTGLGLAITKGLLERHGGRIEIASKPGAGTSVRLTFPAERVRPDGAAGA